MMQGRRREERGGRGGRRGEEGEGGEGKLGLVVCVVKPPTGLLVDWGWDSSLHLSLAISTLFR